MPTATKPPSWRTPLLWTAGSAAFVALFFVVVLLAFPVRRLDPAAPPPPERGGPPVPPGTWVGAVTRVVDGDTVWLAVVDPGETGLPVESLHRVDLAGLDAPEPPQGDDGGGCLGLVARQFLRDMAPPNTHLFVSVTGDGGAADLWLGNATWVNGQVVRRGYALAAGPTRYREELAAVQREAEAARTGLWDPGLCPPPPS